MSADWYGIAGTIAHATAKAVCVKLQDGSPLWLPLGAVKTFGYDHDDSPEVLVGERIESIEIRGWFAAKCDLPLLGGGQNVTPLRIAMPAVKPKKTRRREQRRKVRKPVPFEGPLPTRNRLADGPGIKF